MNNKMPNFSFLTNAFILFLPFHLILASVPIFIAKNQERFFLSWWMQILGVNIKELR